MKEILKNRTVATVNLIVMTIAIICIIINLFIVQLPNIAKIVLCVVMIVNFFIQLYNTLNQKYK